MRRPGRYGPGVICAVLLAGAVIAADPAAAGPPYRTDDPMPVEPGRWEVFAFSTATRSTGDVAGGLPAIDANYGAGPGLQLHALVPIAFDDPRGRAARFGPGDVEFGVKYRFATGDPGGWLPDAAIYPAIDLPSGDAAKHLGSGHARVFLPLWLQKEIGKWTTFGGPGYWLNPGPGSRNFWYFGWAVQRQITDDFAVGAEVFHQTADTTDGKEQTGFNIGAVYDLNDHYHLMFSAGRGVEHAPATNEFSYYAALQLTY